MFVFLSRWTNKVRITLYICPIVFLIRIEMALLQFVTILFFISHVFSQIYDYDVDANAYWRQLWADYLHKDKSTDKQTDAPTDSYNYDYARMDHHIKGNYSISLL